VWNVRIQRTDLSPTNCDDITLQYIMAWSAHGVKSTACRASSGGEENDTSQMPTYHFGHDPMSLVSDNFTLKSVCVLFS